jgi:hypothetical protein
LLAVLHAPYRANRAKRTALPTANLAIRQVAYCNAIVAQWLQRLVAKSWISGIAMLDAMSVRCADGGLISYARSDGSFVHTLATPEGFARKLAALGIDLATLPTAPAGDSAPCELPVGDELDLHRFAPRDVRALVDDWLREEAQRGLREVRIIHGKGRGVQRNIVTALLERHPAVASWRPAREDEGGWGATVVTLAAPG